MENRIYFDMKALTKQKDLRIKNYAETYAITVGEYYDKITELLTLAPDVKTAIEKFIEREGNKEDYRSLDEMANKLKSLGCENHVSPLFAILGAYDTGNWRLASYHAERADKPLNEFCNAIEAAQKPQKASQAGPPEETTLNLKTYLKQLEKEEENRKLVILAVDDSPVILKSVSFVLSEKYKVYTLLRPTELEKVLKKLTPDLFLLDYMMPDINGFELVPIIRNFEEHKETPIIYLTSEGTIDNVTAALAIGASDFVIKPFNPDILKEKIAKHIVKKKD